MSDDPPPLFLIRNSRFLDMLINYFFEPNAKPNLEHKEKYSYLLAIACSVSEISSEFGERLNIDKNELEITRQMIETAFHICHENKASSDLLADLNELFKCMTCSVVAIGILKWVELLILDPSYFKLNTDGSPIHLIILDEIVQNHQVLHDRVLSLLIKLFLTSFPDLDNLIQVDFLSYQILF
jgi:negative elongation factor C/D